MRVQGENPPAGDFTLAVEPHRPGYVRARFYQNVKACSIEVTGGIFEGYEYDEYPLVMEARPGLEDDIKANFAAYLAAAKKENEVCEADDTEELLLEMATDHEARICAMELGV